VNNSGYNVPLVSIVVPTFNSSATLGACLASIREQTHGKIEVIAVDSGSTDRTIEICHEYDARVLSTDWKLLGARYVGFTASKGEHVLLLDTDQVLERTSVARCLSLMDEYDMLCLEESSYFPANWLQWLFFSDRRVIHAHPLVHLSPLDGILIPRFFRREILHSAFAKIHRSLFKAVVAHDHSIIFFECYQISRRIGLVRKAVWHTEPSRVTELWRKNYRYGMSTGALAASKYYTALWARKARLRRGWLGTDYLHEGLRSSLLLLLKSPAYFLGLLVGHLLAQHDSQLDDHTG
jgi:glycosyltransferase involved in cell wall biosynthesis